VPVNRAGNLLGRRVLAAVGVVLACALAAPALAGAETFTVNSTADEVDAAVGNEFCETAAGKCTLRAAIEEANSTADAFDAIAFEEGVFEGDGASVIALTSALPTIATPLSLSGRECGTEASVPGPCVEVDGVANAPVLDVEGAAEVEVETLALTNGEAGINAEEAPRLRVRGSWLGIGLDGAAAGNGTGILLGPGSDSSRIGGEGPGTGNLVGNNDGAGLEILGSSNARVLGNAFGVAPIGDQAAANEVNLEISSSASAPAMDNVVGTRVSPAATATAACDGGCNLVSGSNLSGIDLSGLGGSGPPIGTTIAGNHIGLDATGAGSIPNTGASILVGAAPRTTIGGPRSGDGNRIVGGTSAVTAGGAPHLVVRGNLIGSRANPTGSTAAPQDGLLLDFGGLAFPAEEAQVLENEIGLDGGTGIALSGLGGLIFGNLVNGAAAGIEVKESGFENLIDSNLIEATDVGVLVKGSFNSIVGNEIGGGQETGVRIEGSGLFGASGNIVGGDSEAAENTIDGSEGAAIEIENPRLSLNEVARNRGAGNGGLFIDLVASPPDPGDPEPGAPNGGILPPAIAVIADASVAGFAEPGATVRVFGKAAPAPGEIASFLGQATADEDGNWSLPFPAPLPVGAAIAATQTKEAGTSELEIATVPLPNEGQQPPAAGAQVDRKPPRTRVLRQPRRVPEGGVARFVFASNEAGSSFECRLDGSRFRACKSPKRYRGLRPGKHVFRVRAIDAAGNVDRTPVRRRFEVLD
jgi:CSLREA domain-containing protein